MERKALCTIKHSKLGQFSYKIAEIKAYTEEKVLNYICYIINLTMADIFSDFCGSGYFNSFSKVISLVIANSSFPR